MKCVLESFPEVAVEVSVDERVERRIEVPDPKEDGNNDVWTVTGFSTQGRDVVPVNIHRMSVKFGSLHVI